MPPENTPGPAIAAETVIQNAAQRVGWVARQWDSEQFVSWPHLQAEQFALMFIWSKNLPFIHMEARALALGQGTQRIPELRFDTDCGKLRSLIASVGGPTETTFQPSLNYLGGVVRRGQSVVLDIRINTDDEQFCQLARQSLEANRSIRLGFRVMVIHKMPGHAEAEPEMRQFAVKMAPPKALEPFDGFLALDLGNTNTSLAYLGINDMLDDASERILVIPDADYREPVSEHMITQRDSVRSTVRIDAVADISHASSEVLNSFGLEKPEDLLSRAAAFQWRTGKYTWETVENSDGLVIGPKRLVTRRDENGKCQLITRLTEPQSKQDSSEPRTLQTASVDLKNTIPAELLVCRILQCFRALARRSPEKFVATYPTSYSSFELEALRTTLYRGWLRAESPARERIKSIEEVIPLELDEATAAAFFFLYRRIFEPRGGLQRFRYLYPYGFNLLLYDCGGGTTDISLVSAFAPDHNHLKVSVLGRTGLRDFGGDDITVSVFQLLKAKLAMALATPDGAVGGRGAGGLEPWPRMDTEESSIRCKRLQEYFKRNRAAIDKLVPTRFEPGSLNEVDRRAQRTALRLWHWAERVKVLLSENKSTVSSAAQDDFAKALAGGNKAASDRVFDLMKRVTLPRAEVDCLVQEQVHNSVRHCENLIKTKLAPSGGQVDVVAVVGNASQYPLILEAVKKLNVPALRESEADAFQFELDHLKHSVAKGAALALATLEVQMGIVVEFDRDLSKRLPFTVAWRNAADNTDRPLFNESEKYGELKAAEIRIPPPATKDAPLAYIRLQCKWPGEEYTPFVMFHFPDGVQGEVIIEYDQDRRCFIATSKISGLAVDEERDIDQKVYRPPVQRGEL